MTSFDYVAMTVGYVFMLLTATAALLFLLFFFFDWLSYKLRAPKYMIDFAIHRKEFIKWYREHVDGKGK